MEIWLLFSGFLAVGMFGSTAFSSDETEEDKDTDADMTEVTIEPIPIPETTLDSDMVFDGGAVESERLEGADWSDSFDGQGGDDNVLTQQGDDDLVEAEAEDSVAISDDDEPVAVAASDDVVNTAAVDESVAEEEGNPQDEEPIGHALEYDDQTIQGGAGNDVIRGYFGFDTLAGGAGDDTINGYWGTDTVYGGDGNDVIIGVDHDDFQSDLSDEIDAGAGDDIISFADGSTVTGGAGADSFTAYESLSNELVSEITDFDPSEDSLYIDLGVANGVGSEFTLVEREDGQGSDLFLGDELIISLSGDAPLTLDDINITVRFEYTDSRVFEYTIGDTDSDFGPTLIDSPGHEVITGSSGGDVVALTGGEDIVYGGDGNDAIFADGGYATNVQLDGFDGEDNLIFETQRDTIFGGDGDDVIQSLNGNDVTGGEGEDLFVLRNDESFNVAAGIFEPTVITDFTAGEDMILVRHIPGTQLDPNDVSITALEDGSGAALTVKGHVMAIIYGGQDLTLDDIAINELPDGQYVPYEPSDVIRGVPDLTPEMR